MMLPFILYYLAFACRKVRNLQIGVNELVGKVSISLLCHAKSAACVISIIIDLPAIVQLSKLYT